MLPLEPAGPWRAYGLLPADLEPLSRFIAELNERFGLSLGPEHRVRRGRIMGRIDEDAALDAAAGVNTRENVRLSFDQYLPAHRKSEDLIKGSASKSLEFIPTLRWNLAEDREDRQGSIGVVSCRRSPSPVYLKEAGEPKESAGHFYIRSGPKTLQLAAESVPEYSRTRFGPGPAG